MSDAESVLNLEKWGDNLGVRLPVTIAKAAHLHVNQRVKVAVENGRVVITPLDDAHLTLKQRLAQFDPTKHVGEVLAAERVGAEKW
jgi:antitoxin MazE